MATTPEVPQSQPEFTQPQEEFIVPEKLNQAVPGMKVVQKNFKAQVKSDNGQPVIQTPPAQVITVNPPANSQTLKTWSKGKATNSSTWLGAFWLRIIKKAIFFGWKVITGGNNG